jgi:L-rhamnose mutarotase
VCRAFARADAFVLFFAADAGIPSPGWRRRTSSPIAFNRARVHADRHKDDCASFHMIRKAFVMSVHAGHEAEYERRHRPIWAELEAVLKQHGAHNYSIFLHPETRQLFGYVEIEDEARWAAVASTEVCQRWWKHMADVMPANPDNSPVARDLREVFHID